ncbi:triose-phosphate isomerase [Candidatus Falkowbacteria bacterium]|nr:triose-phosphate isomerase [Candidatus Falkowbacteria bacterium]
MKKEKIIIANWKMNLSYKESLRYIKDIKSFLVGLKNIKIILCPAFVSLADIQKEIKLKKIELGAQDVFWMEEGAYTGEVSVQSLKELGCKYVIVGHSERRGFLNETDAMINKKIQIVLSHNIIPILCIGENLEQRNDNLTAKILRDQLLEDLKIIDFKNNQQIIIAYEPIWAIGTGHEATTDQVNEAVIIIKSQLAKLYPNKDIEKSFKILYGGSVDENNVESFLDLDVIDGFLVGGASANKVHFIKLLNKIKN